jgi:acyl carrier protein
MTDLVVQIVAATLNIDPDHVTDETSPENTPQWSSLAGLKMAVAIQEAYAVELTPAEIVKMRNVGLVRSLLRSKGVRENE